MPQGEAAAGAAVLPLPWVLTAKVDSCFSSVVLAHAGHDGLWPWRVRYSK